MRSTAATELFEKHALLLPKKHTSDSHNATHDTCYLKPKKKPPARKAEGGIDEGMSRDVCLVAKWRTRLRRKKYRDSNYYVNP